MSYAVYTTENFEKEMNKLSPEDIRQIQKIFFQVKENPYVGDQLRYKHLREKRIREKRIYYFVYDDLMSVLFAAISGKKDQQETINHLIKYLDDYKIYLEKILKI